VVLNRLRGTLSALVLCSLAACGGSEEAAAKGSIGTPAGNGGGGAGGAGAAGEAGRRGEGPGGGTGSVGGAGRGRGALSIVLGPNDVTQVRRGTIEEAIAIQGDLKPIEEIAVRARIEGNVVSVNAREGDRVARGQLLARFESSTEESELKSAEADVASAKADVTNAQWNADQSADLFKAGAIPERDLRSAQQTLVAAQARLAAAEARQRAMTQNVEDTRVVAPTTGIVSARSIEAGEHITRGATIFTVVRNDVLELEAAVPSRLAGDVRASAPVRFTAAGRELLGRVARVSPTINPANRSLTVYLQVPNPGGVLRGNTFATGRIVAQTISNTIVIPTSALRYQQSQTGPFVYKIVNDIVEYQPVSVGIVDELVGVAQIVEGLSEGDRVIATNVGAIGRGVKVRFAGAPEEGRRQTGAGDGRGTRGGRTGRGRDSAQVRDTNPPGREELPKDNPVPKPPL
jgi:membrane fusion protein, multidrug efflux system